MPKSALLPCPADRRETLEVIAHTLRGGALSDPLEDLAAWVAGVEVVEDLQRAGFTVVRTPLMASRDAMPSAACMSDTLARLDSMTAAGSPPHDVAQEAEATAASRW